MNTNSFEVSEDYSVAVYPFEGDPQGEHEDHEAGAFGDSRCCPRHSSVKTSSNDGMFDCECHICEGEAEEAYEKAQWDALSPEEQEEVLEFSRFKRIQYETDMMVMSSVESEEEIPF